MTKFKGQKIVNVYSEKSPVIPGGTLISNGGYLGTHHAPKMLFYFDEKVKVAGGKFVNRRNRVTNVCVPGQYKKCQLTGV